MSDLTVGDEYLQEAHSDDKLDNLRKDDLENDESKQTAKRRKRGKAQDTEARRESHKLIEQKRRQRINEKINELRELLNYPDGSQNKAVVLQAAVENIRYLKIACSKMIQHHRQLQEEHMQLLTDNERLRKMLEQQGVKVSQEPPVAPVQSIQDAMEKPNGEPKPSPLKNPASFPSSVDILRGSGIFPPSNESYGRDMDIPFAIYPEEAHAHTLSVLSNSISSLPSRTFAPSASLQMMSNSIPMGLSASSFSNTNPFGDTAVPTNVVAANPPAMNGTGSSNATAPAGPLTSTETTNGVSITRLLFADN